MSFVKPCTRTRYSADCNLVCIKFKKAAKSDGRWMSGLIWGLYLHQKPLFGIPIQIRLAVSPASAPVSIGQNPVLPEARPPQPEAPQGPQPKAPQGTTLPLSSPGLGDRLLNLIKGSYFALNQTRPESTSSCWLCLATAPPYYEGIASTNNFTNSTNPTGCA